MPSLLIPLPGRAAGNLGVFQELLQLIVVGSKLFLFRQGYIQVGQPALKDRGQFFFFQVVKYPLAHFFLPDQVRFLQDPQVLGDSWLGDAQNLFQLADAQFLFGQQDDNPQPQMLAQGFKSLFPLL
ncbi:response regulators consisting of a CheY-like receiver domain and a winged-helix DNA-binding domain [Moorella thermoacetica Y72]|uniref:Response regulators consisting of a CheY-like receiver domain and a winged-helix DNA-binding domain n=1 Tax=Moorella thermoacetica Y72 TaxID=1325331 RepID=A0A0S6UD29_NEOTH|nr:response regulators consisting of a CheY-like receiver domain and a winged-helix DNA-binding domain [Moorella thermoacetica Y72]